MISDKDLEAVCCCSWPRKCHASKRSPSEVREVCVSTSWHSPAALFCSKFLSSPSVSEPCPHPRVQLVESASQWCCSGIKQDLLSKELCSTCGSGWTSATFPHRALFLGYEFLPWCHVYPKMSVWCDSWGLWLEVGRVLLALKRADYYFFHASPLSWRVSVVLCKTFLLFLACSLQIKPRYATDVGGECLKRDVLFAEMIFMFTVVDIIPCFWVSWSLFSVSGCGGWCNRPCAS